MALSVKAEYKKQFRRFRIENNISLHEFYQTLSNVFQTVLEPALITIKYHDDEEDWVTIVKEEEWLEALRLCNNMQTLRVTITSKKQKHTVKKVIEEVEHIVNEVVNETGKVLNKKTFEDAYLSVKTSFENPRAQQQINSVIDQCSSAIESLVSEVDKGVKKVIEQISPPIKEKESSAPPREDVPEEIEVEEVVPKIVEKVEPKPVEPVTIQVEPKPVQPNMEQSWTFIEVHGDPSASIKRIPPSAKFIRDVTFEDHAEVECGAVFVKQWEVQNTGNTEWPESVRVEHVPQGTIASTLPIGRVKPQEKVTISVEMKAPNEQGDFKQLFRLSDGTQQFGPTFWCYLRTIKKQPQKWAAELGLLAEMGFTNDEKNIKLLEENGGDLSNVIQAHLNSF